MKNTALIAFVLFAGAAFAHQGVKNPAVQERMHVMGQIGGAMKDLGGMAKGAVPFDADKIDAALQSLGTEAAKIVPTFEAQEDDPKSEARPEIWTNFSDFTREAEALQRVIGEAGSVSTTADLGALVGALGATCASCHKAYRE